MYLSETVVCTSDCLTVLVVLIHYLKLYLQKGNSLCQRQYKVVKTCQRLYLCLSETIIAVPSHYQRLYERGCHICALLEALNNVRGCTSKFEHVRDCTCKFEHVTDCTCICQRLYLRY